MPGEPLISCTVPVFNGEQYLGETLDSVLNQSYSPVEIIVIDDGSTDGTFDVVRKYGSQLTYVRQENSGAPSARNRGLAAAKGEFVSFLDADDLWHPDKLMRQMKCFRDRPELDVCITHLQNFWIPELDEERRNFEGHRLADVLPGWVTQTLLTRRAFFDKIGWFNPSLRLGDGTDWFLRITESGAVVEILPDALTYRRIHHENMSMELGTRAMTSAMRDAQLRAIKASLDRRRQTAGTVTPLIPNISV